jgi:uncharacterized protein
MRILLLIAIGLLLYVIISHLVRKARQERLSAPSNQSEKMVKCAHCGLHLPEQEALTHKGNFFCSQQHLDEYNH